MKVAILGTVPNSKMLAPFDDEGYEIWVCSPGNRGGVIPRVTRWFELHGVIDMYGPENNDWRGPYFDWLKTQSFPVYMQEPNDLLPQAKVFPRDDLLKEFGRFGRINFTSSISWMIGYAMHLKAEEIGIYGVDMAATEEAYEEARRQLARLNVPPVSDPVLALRKLGGQAQWWNETCAENLNRLRAEELRYPSSVRIEQIRAEVQLYTDSMRICHQVLTSLAKIDLDTWAHLLDQRRAEIIVGALSAALTRPELPPELSQAVRMDFASRLRVVSRAEAEREVEDDALAGVLIPPARS